MSAEDHITDAVWIFARRGAECAPAATDQRVWLREPRIVGSTCILEVEFECQEKAYSWPIIPGCVYVASTNEIVIELHRSYRREDRKWTGISLDGNQVNIPDTELKFRSYWSSFAGRAVLCGPNGWRRASISDFSSDTAWHDEFDWTAISAHEADSAWHNPKQKAWATAHNFEKFVRDDVLGWRADPKTSRPLRPIPGSSN